MGNFNIVIIVIGSLLAGCAKKDEDPCAAKPQASAKTKGFPTRMTSFLQGDTIKQVEYNLKWIEEPNFSHLGDDDKVFLTYDQEKTGAPSRMNVSHYSSPSSGIFQIRFSKPGTTYTSASGATYTVLKSTQVNYPSLPGGTTYFAAFMTETSMYPSRFSGVATGAEEYSFDATFERIFEISERERDYLDSIDSFEENACRKENSAIENEEVVKGSYQQKITQLLVPNGVPASIGLASDGYSGIDAALNVDGMILGFWGPSRGNEISLNPYSVRLTSILYDTGCGPVVTLMLHFTNEGILKDGILYADDQKVTFIPRVEGTYPLKVSPVNGMWLWDFGTFRKSFAMRRVGSTLLAEVGTDEMGDIIDDCFLWGEVDPAGEFTLKSGDVTWNGQFHGDDWKLADVTVKGPGGTSTAEGTRTQTPQKTAP